LPSTSIDARPLAAKSSKLSKRGSIAQAMAAGSESGQPQGRHLEKMSAALKQQQGFQTGTKGHDAFLERGQGRGSKKFTAGQPPVQ
jgi:hypothetical protein